MTTTTKANLIKAARIVLVFLLVFWGSFRVEAVAYAEMSKSSVKEHVEAKDKLTNLTAYAEDASADTKSGLNEKAIASAKEDQDASPSTWKTLTVGDSVKVVAVPSWNDGKPEISKDGDVEVAAFVDWESSDKDVASVKMGDDGVATITAKSAGTATITCALNDDVGKIDTSEFPSKGKAKIRFEIEVAAEPETKPDPKPEPVEVTKSVSELKVFDASGSLVSGSDVALVLPKSQVGEPYTFKTEIKVRVTGDGESFETYDTLQAAIDAGVSVNWTLTSGADVAAVADGVLTFEKEGVVEVLVEAGIGGETAQAKFKVKTEGASEAGDDPTDNPEPTPEPVTQGDSNPQDTLTVVSNALVAPSADGNSNSSPAEGETASGEGDASSSSSSESNGAGDASSSSASQSGEGESAQPQTIEKTYSVSDLEALGTNRGTYTMYDGSEFVTVTGEGPYLGVLLHDIGIDNTDQIESLVFENADGTSTTVMWSELESANRYYPKASEGNYEESETVSPIIALKSLVRGLGDGTGEGADAASSEAADAGDAQESSSSSASNASASASSGTALSDGSDISLLDNTRFRLLFGSTSPARSIGDPDALRYINKITVNVKPNTQEEDPGYNTDIGVSVEYVPVPMGAPAVFSALPNTAIRDARFDFNWEVSTDNGATWKEVENGNVQVLRVVTTEDRIGNQYRVVMSTDAADKDGRENVTVTSDPVTMTEGNGLAVVLEYDPPIAGQTAYFQTTLYGAKSGVDIKYTWQQSQDGGQHWSDIAGRTGSSLAVPTEPIDPNAEKASDDEVVPITYVRVIAEETSGDKRVAISEAVPLTVHVGDDDSGPADTQKPTGENEDKPSTTPDLTPSKPKKPVTPINDIEIEFPSDTDATPTAPTPDGTTKQQIDPSQLYINDEVTEKVNEQQEAVEEYIESTVPGARWTSLSSPQATDDEIRNILADNPFAPFVFPMGLGITVAGGVEKFLAFRRQIK